LQNNEVIAIETIRPAGQFHWLILPKEHAVRDIENLGGEHVELREYISIKSKYLAYMAYHCPFNV
jgi:diadenosine tetraphosphate (Ap4A) HIT family hydrolase